MNWWQVISSRRQIKPEILNSWDIDILTAVYDAMISCPDYVSDQEFYEAKLVKKSSVVAPFLEASTAMGATHPENSNFTTCTTLAGNIGH
jgi:hypothetical protein